MKKKAICFGPPGNIWNNNVIEPLLDNGFKLMFSWRKTEHDLFTVPLSDNLKQSSLNEFKERYNQKKDMRIFTLQFHHANLTDEQFELIPEVIDFLINKEKRTFIIPTELLNICKNDKDILKLISPLK
jgi:hypothetical protein